MTKKSKVIVGHQGWLVDPGSDMPTILCVHIELDARRVSMKNLSVSLGVRGQVKSACNLREDISCIHFA